MPRRLYFSEVLEGQFFEKDRLSLSVAKIWRRVARDDLADTRGARGRRRAVAAGKEDFIIISAGYRRFEESGVERDRLSCGVGQRNGDNRRR